MPPTSPDGATRMSDACGPLVVLLERLGGREGDAWLEWLVKFNQKEHPWADRDEVASHRPSVNGEPTECVRR